MKALSCTFAALAILLSDVMCATVAFNYCECYYCYCHYPEHYHNLLSFFLFLVQRYNFLCAHTNILGEKFQKALFS